MRPSRKFNELFRRMVEEMAKTPMDVRDVSVELGISSRAARSYIADALEEKLIHVHSFYKNPVGAWGKIYAAGDKPPALPPPKRTNVEKNHIRKGRRHLVRDWYTSRKEKHARS